MRKILKVFTIIIITLLLLFIVPSFINWVVSTDLGLGIGFITPENKDTWIGFYGAIIGGGITLCGVAWTIKNQNKKRLAELAIQYKPILVVNGYKKTSTDPCHFMYYVQIKNIGRGEAKDIKTNIKTKFYEPRILRIGKIYGLSNISKQIAFLPPNQTVEATIQLSLDDKNNINDRAKNISFVYTIKYNDFYNNSIESNMLLSLNVQPDIIDMFDNCTDDYKYKNELDNK